MDLKYVPSRLHNSSLAYVPRLWINTSVNLASGSEKIEQDVLECFDDLSNGRDISRYSKEAQYYAGRIALHVSSVIANIPLEYIHLHVDLKHMGHAMQDVPTGTLRPYFENHLKELH